MAVSELNIYDQMINDKFAIYNGDCIPVMATLPGKLNPYVNL